MLSINIDIDYSTNPKIERLTEILGDGSEIYLIRLWAYVAKHGRKNGGREDWTEEALEATVRWYGEKGLLIATLLKLNLLHRWKNGFKVHDWKQHAAHLIAYDNLCEMNRKKAKKGWAKRRKQLAENKKEEGKVGMPPALPKSENGNAKTKLNKTKLLLEDIDFEPSASAINEASYSDECAEVYRYWVEARENVGLRTVTSKEKPDAARVTAYILAGVFSMEDYRLAVDNLMADAESRPMYGLRGLLNNINTWINRSQKQEQEAREELTVDHGLDFQKYAMGLI